MKGNQQINVDICPTVDDTGAARCCVALSWYLTDHPEVKLIVDRGVGETGFHSSVYLQRGKLDMTPSQEEDEDE